MGGISRIFRRDATRLGAAHPVEPFTLVLLDPPYGQGLGERALLSTRAGHWLAPDALIVVEEAIEAAFATPDDFEELERRPYSDTELVFLRAKA
jgi:16S rRNA (guanine966-N2)-methyltransferase